MTSPNLSALADSLNAAASTLSPQARLAAFRNAMPGRIVFTTSLGLEDQAITQMIASERLGIDIITLDTGRTFPETYTTS
jgi:phosphoadenosine phosphosulfate reductase